MGDEDLAASFCHKEFVFASPQMSLQGLEAAKQRLFSQRAPTPLHVIQQLQPKPGSSRERPMYFREAAFLGPDGTSMLAIRQEWVVIFTNDKPLIGSVSAARVASKSNGAANGAPNGTANGAPNGEAKEA